MKHTINIPNFFDLEKISNEYITKNNKEYDLYLVKYDFKLILDKDFYQDVKPEVINNTMIIHLKLFLVIWVENFCERGYKFCHIYEMNTTTIRNKRYMYFEYNIEQPMHTVELKLNKIIDKNPHLMNVLYRSINLPLDGKKNFPFN